jgi:CRP-like cAMP-binding protein
MSKPDSPSESSHSSRKAALQALAAIKHLAHLSPELHEKLARSAVARHFDTGQVIYIEGDAANYLYILEKGWIRATRMSSEGREQAMMFLRPCEVFGDIAVLTGRPYPCTVVALEPVDVWMIPKDALQTLINNHTELANAMIQRLGDRVIHYIELVEDLSLRSVESRLAHTLLKYVEKDGERLIVPRRRWTTFDEMAVRLGTVRIVLSRCLHTLEEEGLLKVERDAILILDPEGLARRGNP